MLYIIIDLLLIMMSGILGGGIAGLTLSQLLGEDSIVFEKEAQIGGLARSIHIDDYIFDQGSHIIFSRDDKILDWMVNQLGTNIYRNTRKTRIYLDGDLIKYPFENDLSSLSKDKRYDCVMGYVDALIDQQNTTPEINNFEDWIYQTFGSGIAEHYMMPYNRKVWCIEPSQMSSHWMEGRVPMPPPEDIIKSSLGIDTEGYTHQLNFYYPKFGGIEAFAHGIADNSTGEILTEQTVNSIEKQNDGWKVKTDSDRYHFDELYNTIPIYSLPKIMDVPSKVSDAINNLRSNGAWLVMIGVEGPSPDYSWMYFADEEILFNRISFPNNFSENTSPDGHHSILVEITCNVGDDVWKMPKEKIISKTVEQLKKVKMIAPDSDIDLTEARKTPLAYVVYDLDYLDNIATVNAYCDKIGLTNVGRFAEFVYYNMDGVIKSAMQKTSVFQLV